ncbi:uncharacterized protein RSE6_12719 [Rhynchosporium secalis]|uniref:Uncharacterized protein n=1 Tax=Rhynchosporium secalis TaxID=38038 RepID=A0A1E1MR37_RHYSE|nr:uncharacterized protein RSE6_12719 [Rhynchosporium secalis]
MKISKSRTQRCTTIEHPASVTGEKTLPIRLSMKLPNQIRQIHHDLPFLDQIYVLHSIQLHYSTSFGSFTSSSSATPPTRRPLYALEQRIVTPRASQ